MNFNLAEEFVLLGLYQSNENFNLEFRMNKRDLCISATFLELLLDGNLDIDDRKIVRIAKRQTPRTDYISKMLAKVCSHDWDRKIEEWSAYFKEKMDYIPATESALVDYLYESILESLIEKGAIEKVEQQFLFIQSADYKVKQEVIDPIVKKLHTELIGEDFPSKQSISLYFLLRKAGVLEEYLSNYNLERFKRDLKKWTEQQPNLKQWIKWTIEAIHGEENDNDFIQDLLDLFLSS
ncbi:GPP34 family phosphoprotein [Thermoflavimicrobium dichotomicum]|uniref:GPP34 family phosphoprotein n=1 Tax=Thermoflavimicrobium dichotomicum TaxID=46223 RepID=UPI0015876314|nr:GPP34 family phosphoprotein [Thermoflavimicrobium dichotomicum]